MARNRKHARKQRILALSLENLLSYTKLNIISSRENSVADESKLQERSSSMEKNGTWISCTRYIVINIDETKGII